MNDPSEGCSILGTKVAVLDYAGAVARAKAFALEPDRVACIAAANTHMVALARHDPGFAAALQRIDLILPDGMPLIWTMNRMLSEPLKDRVYGPTFMIRCLEETQGAEWTHALVGGSDALLAELREKLVQKFPRLQIVAAISPTFGEWAELEDERIIAAIRASGARFVWIGLGCPKQELWLSRNRDRLPPGVYSAVGAAFNFHAGRVRQAPAWMQRSGLEWVFRMCAEPRRLLRRYLVFNSLFLYYIVQEKLFPARNRAC